MPGGIARHEAKFDNSLFHLVIIVFTQYIVIENIIQHYMTQKMALGRALPKPILCNNPYFLVSTDRYGLRQRRLYTNRLPRNLFWAIVKRLVDHTATARSSST